MITGFNHNIKHNGKVYHIQTEDSGVKAPHIITHLFVGGNIIATKKTSYNDLVGSANLDEVVRQMMEEQHKQMLRNLIHGAYDQAANEPAPVAPTRPRATTQSLPRMAPAPVDIPLAAETAAATEASAASAEVSAASAASVATAAVVTADDRGITPPDFPALRTEPELPVVEGTLPVVEGTLPVVEGTPPAVEDTSLLAEPPALPPIAAVPTPAAAIEQPVVSWVPTLRPAVAPPSISASVAPPRPIAYSLWDNTPSPEPPPEVVAARALREKPIEMPAPKDTIFGEDLLDEKSLDEVILSYLADDGDDG